MVPRGDFLSFVEFVCEQTCDYGNTDGWEAQAGDDVFVVDVILKFKIFLVGMKGVGE